MVATGLMILGLNLAGGDGHRSLRVSVNQPADTGTTTGPVGSGTDTTTAGTSSTLGTTGAGAAPTSSTPAQTTTTLPTWPPCDESQLVADLTTDRSSYAPGQPVVFTHNFINVGPHCWDVDPSGDGVGNWTMPPSQLNNPVNYVDPRSFPGNPNEFSGYTFFPFIGLTITDAAGHVVWQYFPEGQGSPSGKIQVGYPMPAPDVPHGIWSSKTLTWQPNVPPGTYKATVQVWCSGVNGLLQPSFTIEGSGSTTTSTTNPTTTSTTNPTTTTTP